MTEPTKQPPIFVGVKMPPAMAQAIRQDAARTGSTMSDVVRLAVATALKMPEPPEVRG